MSIYVICIIDILKNILSFICAYGIQICNVFVPIEILTVHAQFPGPTRMTLKMQNHPFQT